MRSGGWLVLAGVLLVCALGGGCDDSKVPLSQPDEAKIDQSLVGLWRQEESGETNYYHVGRLGGRTPKGLLRVVGVGHSSDGELRDPNQVLVFPTRIEGIDCLNVVGAEQGQIDSLQKAGWKGEMFEAFILVKYRVEGDVLLLWPMDPQAKRRAIESGRIQGEIKEGLVPRIRFTDSAENLRRLIASEGDKLFSDKPLRLERVR